MQGKRPYERISDFTIKRDKARWYQQNKWIIKNNKIIIKEKRKNKNEKYKSKK